MSSESFSSTASTVCEATGKQHKLIYGRLTSTCRRALFGGTPSDPCGCLKAPGCYLIRARASKVQQFFLLSVLLSGSQAIYLLSSRGFRHFNRGRVSSRSLSTPLAATSRGAQVPPAAVAKWQPKNHELLPAGCQHKWPPRSIPAIAGRRIFCDTV